MLRKGREGTWYKGKRERDERGGKCIETEANR